MEDKRSAKKLNEDAHLQEYFEICKRVYEQMERDGTWPWTVDSTNSENMIDSDSSTDDV